jgi:hypothetical protein
VPVEPEPSDHDRVEVSGEEVGEIEGRRLGVVQLLPGGVPRQEPVAVVAGQALDAVALEHLVQGASRAAVRVCDEYALVPPGDRGELRVDSGGDALRPGMELRRETAHGDVLPAVQLDDGEDLARDCAARKDEHLALRRFCIRRSGFRPRDKRSGARSLEDALLVRLKQWLQHDGP